MEKTEFLSAQNFQKSTNDEFLRVKFLKFGRHKRALVGLIWAPRVQTRGLRQFFAGASASFNPRAGIDSEVRLNERVRSRRMFRPRTWAVRLRCARAL
jgi:hypothetical protein